MTPSHLALVHDTSRRDFKTQNYLLAVNKFDSHMKSGENYPTITWDEICALAAQPQEAAKGEGGICLTSTYHASDGRNHDAQRTHGSYWIIALDVDEAVTKPVLLAALDKLGTSNAVLCYWTSGASEQAPRWRVLLPLAKPIQGRDYQAWADAVGSYLDLQGVVCDPALSRPGQPVFLPARPTDAVGYDFFLRDGRGIDFAGHPVAGFAKANLNWHATIHAHQDTTIGGAGKILAVNNFNETHPLPDLLRDFGYEQARPGSRHWRSKYQKGTSYATEVIGGRWRSLSTHDIAREIGPLSKSGDQVTGDAFDLFVHYKHKGKWDTALAAWRAVEIQTLLDDPNSYMAKAIARLAREKQERLAAGKPAAPSDPAGEGDGAAGGTGQPADARGPGMFASAMERTVGLLTEIEVNADLADEADLEDTLADFDASQQDQVDPADWELITRMPSGAFRDFVQACDKALPMAMPELALGAALSGLSAVMSGYAVLSDRGATPIQLWTVTCANSGSGKSYMGSLVAAILTSAGLTKEGMPNSKEGLHQAAVFRARAAGYRFEGDDSKARAIKVRGASDGWGGASSVIPIEIDELTQWMSGISRGDGRAGVADSALGMALSLYNRAVGPDAQVMPSRVASVRESRPTVYNPHLTLTCTTTPKGYLSLLNDHLVASGWGNRCIHFMCNYQPDDQTAQALPFSMTSLLEELPNGCWGPRLKAHQVWKAPMADWHRQMRRIDLTSAQLKYARRRERDFMRVLDQQDLLPALGGRVAEQAIKMAGIAAVLDGAAQAVTLDAWPDALVVDDRWLEWGLWVAERLCLRFGQAWMAQNRSLELEVKTSPARVAEKVLKLMVRMIRDKVGRDAPRFAKLGAVSRNDLVKQSHLSARDFDGVISTLVAGGRIEVSERNAGGNRAVTCYKLPGRNRG